MSSDDLTPATFAEALALWVEDAGIEIGSDEERAVIKLVARLDVGVRPAVLAAGAELWEHSDMLAPSLRRLDAVQILALVVTAVDEGRLSSREAPLADDFRIKQPLVGVFGTPEEAASEALELLRGWAETDGPEGGSDPAALPASVTVMTDLAKVRMWCQATLPGYDWFDVDGVGVVLYRCSS